MTQTTTSTTKQDSRQSSPGTHDERTPAQDLEPVTTKHNPSDASSHAVQFSVAESDTFESQDLKSNAQSTGQETVKSASGDHQLLSVFAKPVTPEPADHPTSLSETPRSPTLSVAQPATRQRTREIEEAKVRNAAFVTLQVSYPHPESNSRSVIPFPPIGYVFDENMAPVKDPNSVQGTIKDIIQHFYEIQAQTHGFQAQTQDALVDKLTELTQDLAHLKSLASPTEHPNNPVHSIRIAPEIVDYVDDGRNPDIFTRDFVEVVQRSNAVINGKQQAFDDFTKVYAKALKKGIPGVAKQVDMIMERHSDDGSDQEHQGQPENGRQNGNGGS